MKKIRVECASLPHTKIVQDMLVARSGNAYMEDAAKQPAMHMLFDKFWHRGELAVLAGGTGAGKSLLGLQIADAISRGTAIDGFCMQAGRQKVLYFDTEHSDGQFANRYRNSKIYEGTTGYVFDDNLVRLTLDQQYATTNNEADALLLALENAIVTHRARVLVLDSLTGLRNIVSKYPHKELFILQRLKQMKEKYHLSVLVTVTTHQSAGRRVKISLMAAMRKIAGFADSIFALGQSGGNRATGYLKQLKSRTAHVTYHEDNVAVCEFFKARHFTGLKFMGHGREEDMLRRGESALEKAIVALKKASPGLSLGEIASELGTYKMKVKRVLDSQWSVVGRQLVKAVDDREPANNGKEEAGENELFEPEKRCSPIGDDLTEEGIEWDAGTLSAYGQGVLPPRFIEVSIVEPK